MFNVVAVLLATFTTVVVHAPKADLTLEVARTNADREYGLMNRRSLPEHTGMIFVFSTDAQIAFWMKNTLVPLDMIFVAADGTVRRVFANVPVLDPQPEDDRIPLEQSSGKYVIELPAGEAANNSIAAGVKLDLGALPPPQP